MEKGQKQGGRLIRDDQSPSEFFLPSLEVVPMYSYGLETLSNLLRVAISVGVSCSGVIYFY